VLSPKKIIIFLIITTLAWTLSNFCFRIRYIVSGSFAMSPTLIPGDRLYISLLSNNYKRGDIITYQSPNNSNIFIKRIIGLPGEKYEFKVSDEGKGVVYINNEPLDEPYIKNSYKYAPCDINGIICKPVIIPEDSYMVMGDNRERSFDSRFVQHGFVHKDKIEGKVLFVWYPLNKMRKL